MITKFKIFEDSAYRGIASGDVVGYKYSQPDMNIEISLDILYKYSDGEFKFNLDGIKEMFKNTKNKDFKISYEIKKESNNASLINLKMSFVTYNERVIKSILKRVTKNIDDKVGEDNTELFLGDMTINGLNSDEFYKQFEPKKIGF